MEPYADVVYIPGNKICHDDIIDADALMIRTRTHCDAELLEGTSVKFIATATIGTDHIDFPYCDSHGIVVRNAPGCNAGGVMEYVFRRCTVWRPERPSIWKGTPSESSESDMSAA